ncbi:hypothetical protein AKJ16_DCAP18496, partial [Drosera capensis]
MGTLSFLRMDSMARVAWCLKSVAVKSSSGSTIPRRWWGIPRHSSSVTLLVTPPSRKQAFLSDAGGETAQSRTDMALRRSCGFDGPIPDYCGRTQPEDGDLFRQSGVVTIFVLTEKCEYATWKLGLVKFVIAYAC